jgi:hypothetical protein
MSATTTTSQHHQHRVPLAAALAVAGVIAAAGVAGFAWQQSDDDSAAPAQAPAETQALRTPTLKDYAQYNYYHGQGSSDGQHRTTFRGGGQVQMGQ